MVTVPVADIIQYALEVAWGSSRDGRTDGWHT